MTAVTKADLRPLAEVTLPYMIQAFSLLGVRQKVSHEMGGQATYNCPIAEFKFGIICFLARRTSMPVPPRTELHPALAGGSWHRFFCPGTDRQQAYIYNFLLVRK
jgi:hypothetical protein